MQRLAIVVALLLALCCYGAAQESVNPLEEMLFVEADQYFEQVQVEKQETDSVLRVPDLRTLELDQARFRLQSLAGSEVLNVRVKRVGSEGPEGVVVFQQPVPGSVLESGVLTLFVSEKLEEEQVRVGEKPKARQARSSGFLLKGLRWTLFFVFQVLLAAVWWWLTSVVERQVDSDCEGYLSLISGELKGSRKSVELG